ncbi:nuclear hormone receptor family protein [Rhizobium alvei]|uniref:Uncharacterized protein n=1 Tax=Rhizobium alvei TaxID=1132659 RepID=A0ABT8YLA7_9HYPH|nr:hypothetical protein [Rhizobium alvei]MDO6964406.1 hypothetical protein [Rhizobium alvei]
MAFLLQGLDITFGDLISISAGALKENVRERVDNGALMQRKIRALLLCTGWLPESRSIAANARKRCAFAVPENILSFDS